MTKLLSLCMTLKTEWRLLLFEKSGVSIELGELQKIVFRRTFSNGTKIGVQRRYQHQPQA